MIYSIKTFVTLAFLLLFSQIAVAANDLEPCDIQFDSMSIKEGSAGEAFILYGKWGETQGEKLPAMNRARLQPLEIISWSDSQLHVRIPTYFSNGIHKVGVYCSDPKQGATYASAWKLFTIISALETGKSSRIESADESMNPRNITNLDNNIGDPLEAYEKGNNGIGVALVGILAAAILLYFRRKKK